MSKKKAIFLDLDHTIIRPKSGEKFPKNHLDWEFIPGVLDQIKLFVERGFLPAIVSNQGGIEKGYQTLMETNMKFMDITHQMEEYIGIHVPFKFAPSMKGHDRKPNPGMVEKFTSEYGFDVRQSVMVGDMDADEGLAKNAGIGLFIHIDKFLKVK